MSTTSIVLIVVLIVAVLVVALLWYKQSQENKAITGVLGLGTKLIAGL